MISLSDKIIELYTRLTESGVRFYYSDDKISFGEVTELNLCDSEYIYITIEYEEKIKVSIEDFKIYHSKENINLYDWSDIREFDRLIDVAEDVG
ncbi:hypothetical protein [Clostridium sp.]|uniref:hypothetical protein n=1 Tax=Clostridium sp. TaxID=1506 RepID=UPI0032169DFE